MTLQRETVRSLIHFHNKHQYDKKANSFTKLEKDDRVLVRNVTSRGGPGKLRSFWEERVYVVIEQKGSNPEAQEGKKGKVRILHRNLLLQCPYLPLDLPPATTPAQRTSYSTSQSLTSPTSDGLNNQSDQSDDSDNDVQEPTVQPSRVPRPRQPPL